MEAKDSRIVISSTKQLQRDWEDAFRLMAERGDDASLDKNLHVQTRWDEDEWQW